MKTIAFFSNKGGVGRTTLVYHLAWMFSELGLRVVAMDLDPQSNLTTMFLPPSRVEDLWAGTASGSTVLGAVQSLLDSQGDTMAPHVEDVDGIGVIPGDIGLHAFGDRLVTAWSHCLDEDPAKADEAFATMTAFHRVALRAAEQRGADVVLLDLGPAPDSINRAALVATDFVIVPLGADLLSVIALRTLGPRLREWRDGWEHRRLQGNVPPGLPVPAGSMRPIGYTVLLHAVHAGPATTTSQQRLREISDAYREFVQGDAATTASSGEDPHLLALLRAHRSLMLLAQEARKPIFALRPADGAMGGLARSVGDAYQDFERLARRIAERCGITIS
ncbi:MAG TPA: ParA family protein [Candidatus Nanopelagicales bacterium]|nr:ParA family protein [Candidatus Nanopelagicales bacterium]